MKRILFISFILACLSKSDAQTVEQYTLWNQNHYLMNPAAAGNTDYFQTAIGFRRQWAGVKDAPRSFYATGHAVLNRPKTHQLSALRISNTTRSKFYNTRKNLKPYLKHAIGGQISTNEFGAFTKTEAILTYALHIPLNRDLYLSFGLSAGWNNYGFNESKASVLYDNDPTFDSYAAGENSNKLNMNSGAYLYSDKFYVGYAAHQLLQNELGLEDVVTTSAETNLEMHHFIMAGYHFDVSNDVRLTPNIMVKYLNPNPISYEVGMTFTYLQDYFIGANYRSEDAISALLGMQINHLFRVGYSFDFTTSELSEQASGSHELFLGFTLF